MTNRDELEKSVDEMLAGWFNGERHDVDRNDIIELVMKHSAATAVPVATVAVMGVSGVRVLIPHPPGSADHLPIGTKLYAAPPAPSVAVKALEWKKVSDEYWVATSAVGTYHTVSLTKKGYGGGVWERSGGDIWLRYKSAKDAMDAEQADYEARIRSTLSAQVQDVAGWQLVPKEPTQAMVIAYNKVGDDLGLACYPNARLVYRAMLAASPSKQEGGA